MPLVTIPGASGPIDVHGDVDYLTALKIEECLKAIAPGPGLPYTTNFGGRVEFGKHVYDERKDAFPFIGYNLLSSLTNENAVGTGGDVEVYDLVVEVHIKNPDTGLLLAHHNARKDIVNALCALQFDLPKGAHGLQYQGYDTTTRQFGSKVTSIALNFSFGALKCK